MNLPSIAGNMGSTAGWGAKISHTAQKLSLYTHSYWAHATQLEKPTHSSRRRHMSQLRPSATKERNNNTHHSRRRHGSQLRPSATKETNNKQGVYKRLLISGNEMEALEVHPSWASYMLKQKGGGNHQHIKIFRKCLSSFILVWLDFELKEANLKKGDPDPHFLMCNFSHPSVRAQWGLKGNYVLMESLLIQSLIQINFTQHLGKCLEKIKTHQYNETEQR